MTNVLSPLERAKIGISGFAEKHRKKRCWLLHDWQAWAVLTKGNVVDNNRVSIGKHIMLVRVCSTCRDHQMKMIQATTK